MRSHAKQLTIIQENHFQNQIIEITQTIRSGKYRIAFQRINKEFERSLIMQTGWRIRLQLLRRGIVCLIKILLSQSRDGFRHENQLHLLRKLQQFIMFYFELLENQAKEYKIFYLKEILYRISQIHLLIYQLSKFHEDVRCMLFWKPEIYFQDARFNKTKFQYNLQVGHLHSQFKLFDSAIFYYKEAIGQCQTLLADIIAEDFHLKKLSDKYSRVISWIITTLYIMTFVYELQSDYNKLFETYRVAIWLSELIDNQGLATILEEQYRLQQNQYRTFMIEIKEINQVLAPIFPQSNINQDNTQKNDYWTITNDKFFKKFNKEVNCQLYSILSQQEDINYKKQHQSRLTEQETTIQSNIHTPRQHEKCKTFNSVDEFKLSKLTSVHQSPQHSHKSSATVHHTKTNSFKFTSDIDIILKRFPKREIESFSSLKAKKELDLYYQQKVLSSFDNEVQIKSLKSLRQQISSQEELDKVCQSDFIVGKKLLKFQKYTHQKVATNQNIMKITSGISKEQEHLEGVNSARLLIQGSQDIEQKIRVQMHQIIKQKSMHNEGELMNLKALVSDYELNLSKAPTTNREPQIEQSQISKIIKEKNYSILKSIDQTAKRTAPEQIKTRKSFLSRIQESLFQK
ncbi:unnamed protein product (macronuclear) [Paramecium tetraurelia]|uniref:BRO1 domain-containing protein n=1 Tax=Paramecium tetraurelia TaxID=5888 RepID=A0D6L6_PARTE|nr:uncharacterized protein GSPATT00001724001 [Paramecium tetraurelia]CAK78683.1 unnamed protein product [Paramecium tetraurelia]|eukprot:XP_001446080.1 hypothetical protein (macronuclear) [Paramecium tetraurelia strain d4-2]